MGSTCGGFSTACIHIDRLGHFHLQSLDGNLHYGANDASPADPLRPSLGLLLRCVPCLGSLDRPDDFLADLTWGYLTLLHLRLVSKFNSTQFYLHVRDCMWADLGSHNVSNSNKFTSDPQANWAQKGWEQLEVLQWLLYRDMVAKSDWFRRADLLRDRCVRARSFHSDERDCFRDHHVHLPSHQTVHHTLIPGDSDKQHVWLHWWEKVDHWLVHSILSGLLSQDLLSVLLDHEPCR